MLLDHSSGPTNYFYGVKESEIFLPIIIDCSLFLILIKHSFLEF